MSEQKYKELEPDEVIQKDDQFYDSTFQAWIPVHDFLCGERVGAYFDKFRRPIPVQEAAMAPGHHLERSGFCNVCGQPNEHVPCACVPVQELAAGKEKGEHCG